MATAAPPVESLGAVDVAADAQLASLVSQATAEPAAPAAPPAPVEVAPQTPSAPAPAVAPVETPTPSDVLTIDLKTLSPEARKDFEDAIKREGDPAKVASRYWEFNRRLGKNGDAAAQTQPQTPEPTPPAPEPLAAPPQEIIQEEVRQRLYADPEVSQMRSVYGQNKAELGDLLKVDASLPKADFDVLVDRATNGVVFEITRLQKNLTEPYVKENPEVEQNIRQQLADLKSLRMEVSRIRLENSQLDDRFTTKKERYESAVTQAKRQEFTERQQAQSREREIEGFATRFDAAWPNHVANAISQNQIGTEIAADFNRMAKYELLGMINRNEIVDETNVPQILDKLAKEFLSEADRHHRYMSQVYANRAKLTAENPVIVPPNPNPQDTSQAPQLHNMQDVNRHYDELLRRTLGEAALR